MRKGRTKKERKEMVSLACKKSSRFAGFCEREKKGSREVVQLGVTCEL